MAPGFSLGSNSPNARLVAVGPDINPTTLACLYNNNPNNVIPVAAWTSADLTPIESQIGGDLPPVSTPEPASGALLAVGIAATQWSRRRRRGRLIRSGYAALTNATAW